MAEIKITDQNKLQYNKESYPEVINIRWKIKEFDEAILKKFPNVREIDCYWAEMKDISLLSHCKALTTLICWNNQISCFDSLAECTSLTAINCSGNILRDVSLTSLSKCTSLTKLICKSNLIRNINPISNLTLLTTLDFNINLISDLTPLQYCTRLTILECNDNKILDISPLRYCKALTRLCCINNKITDLSPLQECTELRELYCASNQITNLEPLIYLRRLTYLNINNNPLNPPSIQVARFLERIEARYLEMNRIARNGYRYQDTNTANATTIYSDTENIHDTQVQRSVMDSVRNLMRDNNVLELNIDSVLTSELKANTKSRLLEYFEGAEAEPHIILLITYKELFTYVWNRIINNPNKLELLKILDDNIQDSECKCFTGRFNRTLSTLVGFYDDIQINISDNSRISAIILQVKDTIIPYDVIKHKELCKIRLLEAGYDSETIDLWITAIE